MYHFKHMLDGTFFTKTIFIAQFYQYRITSFLTIF